MTGITNWERFCEKVIIENCIMETRSAGISSYDKIDDIDFQILVHV
ncbi:hypothetical protein [Dictyoglomus turgidum]|nr:hypothetical protein [Dictyoglomus turgidum]